MSISAAPLTCFWVLPFFQLLQDTPASSYIYSVLTRKLAVSPRRQALLPGPVSKQLQYKTGVSTEFPGGSDVKTLTAQGTKIPHAPQCYQRKQKTGMSLLKTVLINHSSFSTLCHVASHLNFFSLKQLVKVNSISSP